MPYLHYGIALIEAMVIAKVVLIGRIFGFSRRFDDRPLIVPVIYKSLLFGMLVHAVRSCSRTLVDGWIHKRGPGGRPAPRSPSVGAYEIGARTLMLTVAFVPFFAFSEIGRVLGRSELGALFFAKRKASASQAT